MTKYIPYVIIGMLVATLFFTRECQRPNPCPDQADTVAIRLDTIYITNVVEKTVEKPVPVYVHDSIPVNLPIDTLQVVEDYYKYRVYDLKLKEDTLADLSLRAEVWKNELTRVKLYGEIHQKTVIRTETRIEYVDQKRRKVFLGARISSEFSRPGSAFSIQPGLAAALMYQSKKDHAYSVGYDPFNRVAYGTFWYKISFK